MEALTTILTPFTAITLHIKKGRSKFTKNKEIMKYPSKETKINIINMIITQLECANFDMSIVLAIRQFTSFASSRIIRDLELDVENAGSFEYNPYDGYVDNKQRIEYLKSKLNTLNP